LPSFQAYTGIFFPVASTMSHSTWTFVTVSLLKTTWATYKTCC
jgi:hypothetical protein